VAGDCDQAINMWMKAIQIVGRYQKLFVTGCPKSGTTWLARLLNGHPQIVVNGEGRFAWRMYGHMQEGMRRFSEDQALHQGSPLAMLTGSEFAMILRATNDYIFFRYLDAGGKPMETVRVLADKTPQHVLTVAHLRSLYPTCRFINIVRDPRDAATSAMFHIGKNDPRSRAEYIEEFIGETWRMHVEHAIAAEHELGADAFLNIRYEDLHRDETSVVRKCLTLAGVDASEESIYACSQAGSFELLSGGRKRGQADQNAFFRKGVVGDWKNHIDHAVAERCCRRVTELMVRFGYAGPVPEVTTFLHPVAAKAAKLKVVA
jgi:hypothetical protein